MKKPRPTDEIDVQALRVGMYVHLDIGWMSHPFPLSSFRITTAAQLATIRIARPAHRALEPAAERTGTGRGGAGDEHAARAASRPGRRRQRLRPRRRRCRRHRPVHAADRRQRRQRRRPCGAAGPGRTHPQARAPARRRRALHAPVQRGRKAPAATPSTSFAGKPQEAREQAEALSRSVVDKMVGEQDLCIRMLIEGAGDKASMHAMNVGIISLLMGRCFGFSDEEMQDLGVGAMLHDVGKLEMPARLRHREDNFSPNETARLRGARRDGPRAGAPHGAVGRRDGSDRPAPRARRRQRLPRQAEQRPDDDGGAHRRPRQPLRQPLQPAPARAAR